MRTLAWWEAMEGYRGRKVWRSTWAAGRISKAPMQAFSTETTQQLQLRKGKSPRDKDDDRDDLRQHRVSKVLLKLLFPVAQGPI